MSMRKRVIQVTMDEDLLRKLDSDPEVKKNGRSVVLRRAAAMYLRRSRRQATDDEYRRAYGEHPVSRDELGPFHVEPIWPEE